MLQLYFIPEVLPVKISIFIELNPVYLAIAGARDAIFNRGISKCETYDCIGCSCSDTIIKCIYFITR